jgi:hypothetical protein
VLVKCANCKRQREGAIVPLGAMGAVTCTQAWVWTHCSAVFPIAMCQKTVRIDFEPLYTDGKRHADTSS